jgi:hypothetical protein
MRTLWQSFRVDLGRAPVGLWSAFGRLEAYGDVLCRLLAVSGDAERSRQWRDAAARATFAAEADGQAFADPDAAAAVAALYEDIDKQVKAGQGGLSPQTLCADNAVLCEFARAAGLLGNADAGDASLADQLAGGPGSWARLAQLCAWLNGPEFDALPGETFQTAALQAIGAHLFLMRLAPFRRCGEATARLAGYRILRAAGLPAMAAHLPATHFAVTAARYAELIAEVAEPGGATFAFVGYAVDGIAQGLRQQILDAGAAQQANAWRDAVADAFDGRTRAGDGRRRMLAEALARADAPVRIGRLRYLTPKLAEAYARKSEKTLSRDVKWLEAAGLAQRTLQGVRAVHSAAERAV